MSLYGAFDQTKHLDELDDPIETQEGTLSSATRRARVLANLGITATAAELNALDVSAAGTLQASKAIVVDSSKTIIELIQARTTTSTTPSSTESYGIQSSVTASGTGITSGNVRGIRGAVTLSGTVTGGAYVVGLQGKLSVPGTMNHADSRLAAGFVQLDTTGGTFTDGQLSGLWIDHGAGVTGAKGGQFNMLRISDTVAGSKGNAIVYAYANATYAFAFDAPSGTIDYVAAAGSGGTSAGASGGAAADKVLKISVGEVAYYVPLYASNA